MQIMPAAQNYSTTGSSSDASYKSSASSRDLLDFTRIIGGMMEDCSAEISPVLDATPQYDQSRQDVVNTPAFDSSADSADDSSAEAENSAWQTVEAPYSAETSTLQTPAEATPVKDIRLTDSEVHDVIKNLERQGVDADVMRRVAELMGTPGGVPVEDVVKAVAGIKPARLTDGDLQRIASFLDRLNPTSEIKESIMQDLKDGRTERAFEGLTSLLVNLTNQGKDDPNLKLSLDKNELLSLGKALRLDDATLLKLEKVFGKRQESLTLPVKDFREAIAPLETDMHKQIKDQAKAVESLATVLKPVVDHARERLQKEAEAAGQRSRRTEQSEMLIRDTVTQPGLKQTADAAQVNAEKANSDKGTAEKSIVERSVKSDKRDASEKAGAESSSSQTAGARQATSGNEQAENKIGDHNEPRTQTDKQQGNRAGDRNESRNQTGNEFRNQTGNESNANSRAADSAIRKQAADGAEDGKIQKKDSKDDPIEALLRKLEVRNEETPRSSQPVSRGTIEPQPLAASASMPTQNSASQMAAQVARNSGTTAARVLSQVEQGVFSALADGTKRLTLNLNPVELGAVSVVLSSRNGEVSALIKPERAETAAVMAQQADALRHSLEQQGIKVDKVDVQTPQSQNQGQNWQGMDQHNAAQEHQSQQQTMSRLRRMGALRGSDASIPEISGQALRQSARTTPSSGLNLVA